LRRNYFGPIFSECQRQLREHRENQDQLEGFQSQELAKVKHMLLSAETALEQERKLHEATKTALAKVQETSKDSMDEEKQQLKAHVASLEV